jgi:recombination protein RecT
MALQQRIQEKALTQAEKVKRDFQKTITAQVPEFQKALGGSFSGEFFARVLMTAASKTPKIMECTRESILECAMHCAQLRLLPNTPLGHAHLIPFGKVLTLVVGHQGWTQLAMRTGAVAGILAEAVCVGDEFAHDITTGEITHTIAKRKIDDKTGLPTVVGAWARAKLRDGTLTPVTVLTLADLERVMRFIRQRNGDKAHYSDNYPDRWAANSVLKRFVRTKLPLNEEIVAMVMADSEVRLDAEAVGDIIDTTGYEVERDGTVVNRETGEIVDAGQLEDADVADRRYVEPPDDNEPPPHGEPAPRSETKAAPPAEAAPNEQQQLAKARTALMATFEAKKWRAKDAREEAKTVLSIDATDFKGHTLEEYQRMAAHFEKTDPPGK